MTGCLIAATLVACLCLTGSCHSLQERRFISAVSLEAPPLHIDASVWPTNLDLGDNLHIQIEARNDGSGPCVVPRNLLAYPISYLQFFDQDGRTLIGRWPYVTPAPILGNDLIVLGPGDSVETIRSDMAVIEGTAASLVLTTEYAEFPVTTGLYRARFVILDGRELLITTMTNNAIHTTRAGELFNDERLYQGGASHPIPIRVINAKSSRSD